jgi:hypothetical protein
MKIAREKLFTLASVINNLLSKGTSVKFHYLLHKNKRVIDMEITTIQEAHRSNPPEHFQEFESKRVALCEKFADKDENGKPKRHKGDFVISDTEGFSAEMDIIKEEYPEIIEHMENSQRQFMEFLQEEVELDTYPIPLSVIPDVITGQDIGVLYDIIDGDK